MLVSRHFCNKSYQSQDFMPIKKESSANLIFLISSKRPSSLIKEFDSYQFISHTSLIEYCVPRDIAWIVCVSLHTWLYTQSQFIAMLSSLIARCWFMPKRLPWFYFFTAIKHFIRSSLNTNRNQGKDLAGNMYLNPHTSL